jgi:hypothetical protein
MRTGVLRRSALNKRGLYKVQRTEKPKPESIYRKPTHTDQYLIFTSNHHLSAKNSVANTLVYRALTLCDKENRNEELKHIEKALNNNGYPSTLVKRAIKKQTENLEKEKVVEDDYQGITFMPFVKGVSDKICRFLNRAGVTTSLSLADLVY